MSRSRWEEMEALRHRVSDYLFGFPGVHAVGARRKVVHGVMEDRPAISVYVSRKRGGTELARSWRIPREVLGCPTDVFEEPMAHFSAGSFEDMDTRHEVLEGGFAIESNEGPGAATLACLANVTQGSTTFPVALTCQHVLSKSFITGVQVGAIVGHPSLSSWCATCWSSGNVIGTCLWGSNTGQKDPSSSVVGVDAGAVKLKVGQKYKETIFNALATGDTTKGSYDPTPNDIHNTPGGYKVHMVGKTSYSKRGTSHGAIVDVCNTAVTRNDQQRYFYRDCYLVRTGSQQTFSEDADSGSAVFDNARRVIGLLFAGGVSELQEIVLALPDGSPFKSGCIDYSTNPPQGTHLAAEPGSWVCKMKNVIDQFATDNPGMTLSIPTGDGSVKTVTGPAEASLPALKPGEAEALARARERLQRTELGREISSLFRAHRSEVRELIATNRHVAVAWHRLGGPTLPFAILDATLEPGRPLPERLGRVPLREGVRAFGATLSQFGSRELCRDVEAFGPILAGAASGSLDDFLATMEAPPAPEPGASPV